MIWRVRAGETLAFSWLTPHLTLARAIEQWQPALVICVDHVAVQIVQTLHRLVRSQLETANPLVALIEDVPRVCFVEPASTNSFGSVMRFVAGAQLTDHRLAARLSGVRARDLGRGTPAPLCPLRC